MSRHKISTTVYLTPEQVRGLKDLHEQTRVPTAVYIREGVDLILQKGGVTVERGRTLSVEEEAALKKLLSAILGEDYLSRYGLFQTLVVAEGTISSMCEDLTPRDVGRK